MSDLCKCGHDKSRHVNGQDCCLAGPSDNCIRFEPVAPAPGCRCAELAAELATERKKVADMEKPAAFGWQCYQDRCENAYVEASVVKRQDAEIERLRGALTKASEQLERAYWDWRSFADDRVPWPWTRGEDGPMVHLLDETKAAKAALEGGRA